MWVHCSRLGICRVGSTPGGAVLEGQCGARHVLRRRRDRHCNEALGHALVGVIVLVLALPVILCCENVDARRQYLASKLNLQKDLFDTVRISFQHHQQDHKQGRTSSSSGLKKFSSRRRSL